MKNIILIIAALLVLGVLWWAFSPLLFDREVHDELDPTLQARLEAQRRVDAQSAAQQQNQATTDTAVSTNTESTEQTSSTFSRGPFPITGTTGHPATGNIEVIYSPEETLLQYKDYDGTNGPDLYVYLAKDLSAKEFISLGPTKGNKGTIIYGVPMDVNLDEYPYVITWCKTFGVLFDYAKIN